MKCYMIPTSHHTWTVAPTHVKVFLIGAVMHVTFPPWPPLPLSASPLLGPSESSEDWGSGSNKSAFCFSLFSCVCQWTHRKENETLNNTTTWQGCSQWKFPQGAVASSSKLNWECWWQEVTYSVPHPSISGLEGCSPDFTQGCKREHY